PALAAEALLLNPERERLAALIGLVVLGAEAGERRGLVARERQRDGGDVLQARRARDDARADLWRGDRDGERDLEPLVAREAQAHLAVLHRAAEEARRRVDRLVSAAVGEEAVVHPDALGEAPRDGQ